MVEDDDPNTKRNLCPGGDLPALVWQASTEMPLTPEAAGRSTEGLDDVYQCQFFWILVPILSMMRIRDLRGLPRTSDILLIFLPLESPGKKPGGEAVVHCYGKLFASRETLAFLGKIS